MPSRTPLTNEQLRAEITEIIHSNVVVELKDKPGYIDMAATEQMRVDQIMALFHQTLAAREVEERIDELQHVDRHTIYYTDGSEPIEAQARIAALQQSSKDERKL